MATLSIKITWNYIQDPNKPEDGFIVQRTVSQNNAPGVWAEIARVGVGMSEYSDINVVSGTTYFYRVASYSGGSVSNFTQSSAVSAVNPIPNAVTSVTAVVAMIP